jgi:hypothetical protein
MINPVNNVHATPNLDHAHLSFSKHLIKSILVRLVKPSFHSQTVTFFHLESASSSLVVLFPSVVKGLTAVHMNETIRIQCGTKFERLNICRVIPFTDKTVL